MRQSSRSWLLVFVLLLFVSFIAVVHKTSDSILSGFPFPLFVQVHLNTPKLCLRSNTWDRDISYQWLRPINSMILLHKVCKKKKHGSLGDINNTASGFRLGTRHLGHLKWRQKTSAGQQLLVCVKFSRVHFCTSFAQKIVTKGYIESSQNQKCKHTLFLSDLRFMILYCER